ncbi:MAG: RtcB family protein [Chloroherpetonaceae bacterium]|nr:RtcB family protein [Chthonomonadaceae bacterium]MDW8207772.1 RtcB family protein [Chloroherpetonaceae bacterium]
MSLKWQCVWNEAGHYYELREGVRVPVRLFLSPELFAECEEEIFQQIVNATNFPGVQDVVITPDVHTGYVVPVGCVMATSGTLCQAPVGFDIGCGMLAFRSRVSKGKGLDETLRRRFSERVLETVGMGMGRGSGRTFSEKQFNEIVRRGANALGVHRENSERDFIPVSDQWDIPRVPLQRGIGQLGSLGGGNHFCELQYDQEDHLWVMVHTGSRGFGHGLATYYIQQGKEYLKQRGVDVRGGAEAVYFEPDSPLYEGYRNAVAAGANFAIANRLLIWEAVGHAFEKVFGEEPELVYEISHNLAQEEEVPSLGGKAWVHRKGATRAFPAGHPMLRGTKWEKTGHPILIPGSMGDKSYILFAEPGAEKSLYSVNHGCGRRLSRSEARRRFSQKDVNEQMKRLNVLVNAGRNVPIDESPNCYKPARAVIDAVVQAGLARVAYELTPIASLKGVD